MRGNLKNNAGNQATAEPVADPAKLRIIAVLTCWHGPDRHSLPATRNAARNSPVTCAACHGADGNSVNPEWPSLAGQHVGYLTMSLTDYRDGIRE